MPSLYEAFSLVSLEAAASGLPILASPVSGTEELIEEGQNGWVLPADPTLWAARLNALATDRGIYERMSHRAREVALLFPWDRGVARFEELYGHANT
jgi:glycosyltransferase involved in cell wall biosynthesis